MSAVDPRDSNLYWDPDSMQALLETFTAGQEVEARLWDDNEAAATWRPAIVVSDSRDMSGLGTIVVRQADNTTSGPYPHDSQLPRFTVRTKRP